MSLLRLTLACLFATTALAQQPAPLDAKALKQYEQLTSHRYTRDINDVFTALERANATDAASQQPANRFILSFRMGDWAAIRTDLASLPPELSRRIFDKMLGDLSDTARQRNGLKLDDVLGLADAVPGELTDNDIRRIGALFSLTVPANENFWLSDRLKKGTAKLGGTDPAKRLLAGRALLAGGFKELARAYLPDQNQIDKITDENTRAELTAFLAAERETENIQREQIQRIWDENVRTLTGNAKSRGGDKAKAAQNLTRIVMQIQPALLTQVFGDLLKNEPDDALLLVTTLERKFQNESRSDPATRTDNLKIQGILAGLLVTQTDLAQRTWNQVVQQMAELWMNEADHTFSQYSNGGQTKPIPAEELLATAPAGKWLSALSPNVRDHFDVALSKVIIASANFEAAADRIVDISHRNPAAGISLAENFITAWGQAHNPQIPEALRRRYGLPEDARIPVTPIMMDRNIESLARMMGIFRAAHIAPRDYGKVVAAFDLAYSNAEAYRESHIEKVFGPLAQMDEQLFSLLISRMHTNLTDRWRKMDIQRSGLTRRNEGQTLDMVRTGYAATLHMIDAWTGGHQDTSRALTLAGTLLTDWGDFEYFQELALGDPKKRLTAYKEKNFQAQAYFRRATEAYAKEMLKLAPGEYTVAAYLGWFHGLLGLGSGNQVNLSKTLNRAALEQIRTNIRALPGKAAGAHMNLFAKTINARLADENNPLHEDLKYRYLASSLIITKNDPFTLGAEKKVAYFDELLKEIRLQTRVDGPNTIGRDQEFGLIVSIVHTEAMGRVAQFGQYLSNDPAAVAANRSGKRRGAPAKKMRDTQGARDDFENHLNETLTPFFDIRSITFATPEVKPRPAAQAGWEETILAYVLVKAKDASVDKIPPVQLELKFLDLSGPVTIPATSAETVIKFAATGTPRPAQKVEITQTLDTRQFAINGTLALEVHATANGLVPDLADLLDLATLKRVVDVRQINAHEGLQVKELNTWGEQVMVRSERLWTISLNGDRIRAAKEPVDVLLPTTQAKDSLLVSQTYQDQDLIKLTAPAVKLGRTETAAGTMSSESAANPYEPWAYGLGGGTVLAALLFAVFGRRGPKKERPLRARDVFKMPAQVDGFAVIAFLRRFDSSPLVKLGDKHKHELQADLSRVQQTCFGDAAHALPEAELRTVLTKWMKLIA